MNSKQSSKIKIFLMGFRPKIEENDYFVSLSFTVSSGSKDISGEIAYTDKKYTLSFAGEVSFDSFEAMSEYLVTTLIKYDKAIVTLTERGLVTQIIADDRDVKVSKQEQKVDAPVYSPGTKNKKYNISLHKAKELLYTLGYTTEDGKLRNDKIRKYNQTDRFIDLIGDMFEGKTSLNIVDCGCGKSYLSFILNYWLWEEKRIKAHFYGIDISEGVIDESRKMAKKLGYSNMDFIQADLSELSASDLDMRMTPDAVISLHACDTATDMALGYAIRKKARNIICVPCCHKELLDRFTNPAIDNLVTEGILKARFNSILTDSLRILKLRASGYEVSAIEYCSPLDTPKNLLIRARRVGNPDPRAEEEYRAALRDFGVYPAVEIYSSENYNA